MHAVLGLRVHVCSSILDQFLKLFDLLRCVFRLLDHARGLGVSHITLGYLVLLVERI